MHTKKQEPRGGLMHRKNSLLITVKVVVSSRKNHSSDKFLYHKTTNRRKYDSEFKKYRSQGFFDVIFFNEKNELCEGAISNIFIRKGGKWFTPAISSGILPGIYRKFLLENLPDAAETKLFMDDLIYSDALILVNSLRGQTSIQQLYLPDGRIIEFDQKKNF